MRKGKLRPACPVREAIVVRVVQVRELSEPMKTIFAIAARLRQIRLPGKWRVGQGKRRGIAQGSLAPGHPVRQLVLHIQTGKPAVIAPIVTVQQDEPFRIALGDDLPPDREAEAVVIAIEGEFLDQAVHGALRHALRPCPVRPTARAYHCLCSQILRQGEFGPTDQSQKTRAERIIPNLKLVCRLDFKRAKDNFRGAHRFTANEQKQNDWH